MTFPPHVGGKRDLAKNFPPMEEGLGGNSPLMERTPGGEIEKISPPPCGGEESPAGENFEIFDLKSIDFLKENAFLT